MIKPLYKIQNTGTCGKSVRMTKHFENDAILSGLFQPRNILEIITPEIMHKFMKLALPKHRECGL